MGGGTQSKVKKEQKLKQEIEQAKNQDSNRSKQQQNDQTAIGDSSNNNINDNKNNDLIVSQDEIQTDNTLVTRGKIKRKKHTNMGFNQDIKKQPEKGFRIRESRNSLIQGDEFGEEESIQRIQQSPTRVLRGRRQKNGSQFIVNGQFVQNDSQIKQENQEMGEIKLMGGNNNYNSVNSNQQVNHNASFMSNQSNGQQQQQRYKRNSNKHLDSNSKQDHDNIFSYTTQERKLQNTGMQDFQTYSQMQDPNYLQIKQQQFKRENLYSPVKLQRGRYNENNEELLSPELPRTDSGLVGLHNIGNTCFMNSTLQCMFNLPIFNEIFLQGNYKKQICKNNKGIAKNYAELLQKIRKKGNSGAENPSKLKKSIELKSAQFAGNSQQDAQELLVTLLQGLHDDINLGKKPKYKELTADLKKQTLQEISDEWFQYYKQADNSHIQDYFCGQLLSKVICTKCSNESLAFDNYLDLSLSFSRAIRMVEDPQIERLFTWFLTEEQLDDEYYCSKCKKHRKCTRKFIIYKLPNILVIHLKRFHYGRTRREKINNRIKFPIKNLDLSQYVKDSKDPTVKDCVYDLVGIVNHVGNLYGGHYVAECKNPNDKRWYSFNDSNVSEIDITQEEYEKQGSGSPYLLFYAKKSMLQNNKPLL